jgi:predicted transcriptional regulator
VHRKAGAGKIRTTDKAPRIWFESVESMAQILSTRNRELLRTIKECNPQSLTELAIASGRRISNLSRTLKSLEKYGIVELSMEAGSENASL